MRRSGTGAGWPGGLVLFATLLVGGLGAARPAEAREMRFGFNDAASNIAAAGNLIPRAGGDIARAPVSWGLLEPRRGVHRFDSLDAIYEPLLARGVKPLFAIYGAAAWAQNRYEPGVQVPDDHHAWRKLWRTLAQRYPRAIWQIWNEPNHPYGGTISPRRAAALVRSAARAIHSVDPRARVLGPAVAPIDGWRRYMRALYRRLGGGIGVAVNLYPRNPPRWRAAFRSSLRFATRIAGRQRLWITETGLSRSQYGRRRQARGSAWIYRRVARTDAAALIFHRLARARDSSAWDRGLALTSRRFEPLSVYRALRAARAGYDARGSRGRSRWDPRHRAGREAANDREVDDPHAPARRARSAARRRAG